MEYEVPQFIEVEDKIVGPLTLAQFIYLAGGAGLCLLLYLYLPLIFAIVLMLPVAGLAAALAFYKMNGKTFTDVLESALGFYTGKKLFLWKHEDAKASENVVTPAQAARAKADEIARTALPKLTASKLRDLAWSLDMPEQETH